MPNSSHPLDQALTSTVIKQKQRISTALCQFNLRLVFNSYQYWIWHETNEASGLDKIETYWRFILFLYFVTLKIYEAAKIVFGYCRRRYHNGKSYLISFSLL